MNLMLLIVGMVVVTYIPRALPAVFIDKLNFSLRFEKFLSLIPYTAMAALIFPGVLNVDPDIALIGIAGAAAAIILSWFKCPITVVVVGAVLTDMVIYMLI